MHCKRRWSVTLPSFCWRSLLLRAISRCGTFQTGVLHRKGTSILSQSRPVCHKTVTFNGVHMQKPSMAITITSWTGLARQKEIQKTLYENSGVEMNLKVGGGHRPGTRFFLSYSSTFSALQVQLVMLVSAFVMVSIV